MTESINKLRKLCQDTRDDEFFQTSWADRHGSRKISIYITKLFLKLGISANQASLISLFIVIIGGVFFTFSEPGYWLISILLFYLYRILDCVDGEIARYTKTTSIGGDQLDGTIGILFRPYMLACMTFGIYNSLHNPVVFIFGFSAVIFPLVLSEINLVVFFSAYRQGLPLDIHKTSQVSQAPVIIRFGRILIKTLYDTPGLEVLPQVLIATIIDYVIPPFTIMSFALNARFLYMIMVGLMAPALTIILIYRQVVRYGTRV